MSLPTTAWSPSPTKRRRTLQGAGVVLAAAFALAGCGGDATAQADGSSSASTSVASTEALSTEAPSSSAPATTSTSAPATEAPVIEAISGNQVDFGDALAQDTVLWFWAPW